MLVAFIGGYMTCWDLSRPEAERRPGPGSSVQIELRTPLEQRMYTIVSAAFPDYQGLDTKDMKVVLSQKEDGDTLMLVQFSGVFRSQGGENLAVGVWDGKNNRLSGTVFGLSGDNASWEIWEEDEKHRLLLTNSTSNQGWISCSGLLLLEFDGSLRQVGEIPQAAWDSGLLPDGTKAETLLYPSGSSGMATKYWTNLLAEIEKKGVRLYRRTPGWNLESKPGDQWQEIGWVPLSSEKTGEKASKPKRQGR